MSTRSRIAVKNQNGSYDSIYVHFDGYGHLPILNQFYSTEDKVRELINLGDLSVLGEEIGTKTDFSTFSGQDQCLAYGRDRGETSTNPINSVDYGTLLGLARNCGAEYLYIFEKGKRWGQITL